MLVAHLKSVGVAFTNCVKTMPRDLPFTRLGYGFKNGNGGNVVRDAFEPASKLRASLKLIYTYVKVKMNCHIIIFGTNINLLFGVSQTSRERTMNL